MARKSRKNVQATPAVVVGPVQYKVALYARISVENEQKREADTIGNQIALLKDFVSQHQDLVVFDLYCDDDTPSSQTRYQIYETQIDDAKRKIEKFNQLKAALYGDFADGLLSHQDYTDLSEDYSRRADDLRIFIAELEKEKEKYSAGFGSKMQWALLIEKYKDQESLDAEMAAAFIETLTLFNDGHVEVAFRHRDEIEQVLYVAATRGKEAERYAR